MTAIKTARYPVRLRAIWPTVRRPFAALFPNGRKVRQLLQMETRGNAAKALNDQLAIWLTAEPLPESGLNHASGE